MRSRSEPPCCCRWCRPESGLLLTGFSGGLLGLYIKIPGMRQEGSLRPTQQGIALAKDSWLLGIGASLILSDVVTARPPHPARTEALSSPAGTAAAPREREPRPAHRPAGTGQAGLSAGSEGTLLRRAPAWPGTGRGKTEGGRATRARPPSVLVYQPVAGLTAPRMSTTNTSVSVPLMPACELPVFP